MRKRYQQGSLTKVGGNWIAQWWEDGHRRKRTLGRTSKIAKSAAQAELDAILQPINARTSAPSPSTKWGEFMRNIYSPFYSRKWKLSTRNTNEERFRTHLFPIFEERKLGSFNRDELQDLLDAKASVGLSYSTVAHLRWDLRQIFRMAVQEGHLVRNPAELLFIPRDAKRPVHTAMNEEEVQLCFSVLELRERLIMKFAILAGLRPGEIFALKWGHLATTHVEIQQGVYRGKIDSPKTNNSYRKAALAAGLLEDIEAFRAIARNASDDSWLFANEKGTKPVWKDNLWRKHIGPKLVAVGLGWVDFHVTRRTHSTLMNEVNDDPKLVADQLVHTLDVNQNVYTRKSIKKRKLAVDALESALKKA